MKNQSILSLSGLMAKLAELPRSSKRTIMLVGDMLLIPIILWLSVSVRLGYPEVAIMSYWWMYPASVALAIPFFVRFGLYRAVVRYLDLQFASAAFKVVTLSAISLASFAYFTSTSGVPRSAFVIYWAALLIYLGSSRFLARAYFHRLISHQSATENVIIYGAGSAGAQLAHALSHGPETNPVAFIDDDSMAWGSIISGLRVHSPIDLQQLIETKSITKVLLAIPTATRRARKAIVDRLEDYPVHVFTIPGTADLISGTATLTDLKEIDIEDLLGREAIPPIPELLDACVKSQSVLVTGAGGSIGSELCRQLLHLKPTRLVLFELSEFNLYQIDKELRQWNEVKNNSIEIISLLGSVRDQRKLESVISEYKIDTIYHAAAYKHVPLVEHNYSEGLLNNVFGTLSAALAAISGGVSKFILISTDKAVRPTNIMGASKRIAEIILQALSANAAASNNNTQFSMVRFGNVLGSSGSVVPLFREQIRQGGPLTVTHADIIRYFMTIPEAAQLVIQAGSMGEGGDVFVLDMGEPVKIADLAARMIHLMGSTVAGNGAANQGDIEIHYTGLRPGEKLYEELLIGDNPMGTEHPRILRAEEEMIPWETLTNHLDNLQQAIGNDDLASIKSTLRKLVSGYNSVNSASNEATQPESALTVDKSDKARSTSSPIH